MRKYKFLSLIFLTAALLSLFVISAPQQTAFAQLTNPTPTPLPDPLASPLPTTFTVPQSAWRPALYPVPWALTSHDHFYFQRPVNVDEVNWPLPSYRYGGNFFGPNITHTGVDIVTPEGTPVLAAADGQILWAGRGLLFGENEEDDAYGIAIAIAHDFGWDNQPLFTLYAHLSEAKVTKGQRVKAGELIALSGNTGFTTAPHLHFEVRFDVNNYYQTLNPELWLAPPQGYGVIAGRLTDGANIPLLQQAVVIINTDTNQEWHGESYSSILTVNSDPYYNENFVISDLPAGNYKIQVPYFGYVYQKFVTVEPGGVTYFRYKGLLGFSDQLPSIEPPQSIQKFLEN